MISSAATPMSLRKFGLIVQGWSVVLMRPQWNNLASFFDLQGCVRKWKTVCGMQLVSMLANTMLAIKP